MIWRRVADVQERAENYQKAALARTGSAGEQIEALAPWLFNTFQGLSLENPLKIS